MCIQLESLLCGLSDMFYRGFVYKLCMDSVYPLKPALAWLWAQHCIVRKV